MKTNERVDREIQTIADLWNSMDDRNPNSEFNRFASAIYRTLRWARGLREREPHVILRELRQHETASDALTRESGANPPGRKVR